MIQINLTLLVQALNFSLTFYVLKRFLFGPIIENILSRKKEEKRLSDEIVLKKQDVDNFLGEKTSQLSQFQKDAKTDFPFVPVTGPRVQPIKLESEIVEPSVAEQEALQKSFAKRVRDGS